ncbi:septum formation family protein [Micromonosporaceae bacterium Da 78-11]
MRRWRTTLGWAAAVLVLAGCAEPPTGVDGALTDDWGPLPVARQFRPAEGTCHENTRDTATPDTYAPVPCAEEHTAETFHVGDLGGDTTTVEAARPRAYQECARLATTFAGADWRTGWLAVQTVLPGRDGWAGGARWFRCDLGELDPLDGDLVRHQGSLHRAMVTQDRLVLRCFTPTVTDAQVSEMRPAGCTSSHTAEFAGLWVAPSGAYAELDTTRIEKGCDTTIARFAAVPDDGNLPSRTGWLGFPPSESMWQLGDRSVQCFLWLDGEEMTSSYRRAGPRKLKIHYSGR